MTTVGDVETAKRRSANRPPRCAPAFSGKPRSRIDCCFATSVSPLLQEDVVEIFDPFVAFVVLRIGIDVVSALESPAAGFQIDLLRGNFRVRRQVVRLLKNFLSPLRTVTKSRNSIAACGCGEFFASADRLNRCGHRFMRLPVHRRPGRFADISVMIEYLQRQWDIRRRWSNPTPGDCWQWSWRCFAPSIFANKLYPLPRPWCRESCR